MLSYFGNELLKCKPQNIQILVDLPGLWLNGGTIPPDILVTSLRPDMVLINRTEKKIELLELTCSFEKNIEEAYIRKYKKYLSLKTDIEKNWLVCSSSAVRSWLPRPDYKKKHRLSHPGLQKKLN